MQTLTQQFIDNRWVASRGERRLPVVNPTTEAVIAEVTAGHPEDVNAAVAAARRALPAWQALSDSERAAYLEGFAEALSRRREALMHLSSTNNGKVLAEAGIDLDDAIACYRYYAGEARRLDARQGQLVPLEMNGVEARCYQDPIGVVGLITPWNFPLVTSAWKLAPALAAGCTAVLKPSEVTPLPEQVLAEIALEVNLPAGVLNLLHGDGEGIGAPLSCHPGVDKVPFTGSNRVGEAVMRAAAGGTKGVSLELGGKSPILVMADADQEGLTAVRDGRRREVPSPGFFLAPSLYRDVPVESRLWREEIFGPVLCGRSVADEEEAIELANASDFSLAATVISRDKSRAAAIARRLHSGTTWINSEQWVLPQTSWGGFKRSGIGRELGPWGLAAYLEVKHCLMPA